MSVLDRAKEHFSGLGRQCLTVPEWGASPDAPLMIYWTPVTVREHNKIYPPAKEPGLEAAVTTLILKAEDVDGKKLFTDIQRDELMTRVDRRVVIRVAAAIVGDSGVSTEAVKLATKN